MAASFDFAPVEEPEVESVEEPAAEPDVSDSE